MWAQELVAPRTFQMVEVATPTAGDLSEGQVLLRVLAGAVCGSDLPAFLGRDTALTQAHGWAVATRPGFPLHEVVGEVLASRHADVVPGMQVVGWAAAFDALSELIVTDGEALHAHRPALSPQTAVMIQPLACVLHALQHVSDIPGATAAVVGLGPFGVLFAHALRSLGASRVVGVDEVDRTDVKDAFGLTEVVSASAADWAASLPDADRPDIVVEAVGHNLTTLNNAVDAVAMGGQVYGFGIPDQRVYPFELHTFLRKNLRLRAGVTVERRAALARADAYLAEHPELAEAYLTDGFGVADATAAFECAVRPKTGRLKVSLSMV